MRCRRPVPILLAAAALVAVAHPMGNFSVSHYTRLETGATGVRAQYALDLAELPTFELLQKWGLKQDASPADLKSHAAQEMREWAAGLHFKSNGSAVAAKVVSTDLKVSDGAGGLPVFHITATLSVDAKPGVLEFEDSNFPERAGWKEIVIAASPNVTKASHGAEEKSKGLTAYPADPTAAPPQDLRARIEWMGPVAVSSVAVPSAPQPKIEKVPQPVSATPAPTVSPAVQQKAPGEVTKGDALSQLVSQKDLSPSAVLIALALAFGFGCAHAMTPGHGKTMVAAYLVGERGTPTHALLLGLTTTFTHTISVFALGLAMYFLAGTFAPEKVTRILEFVSGMSIAVLGCWLVYQRLMKMRGLDGHHHHHGHSHAHSHSHSHAGGGHHHMPEGEVTLGSILALGASGGLVPCPSALVLLLSSIAIGRVGLGLVLLVAFSTGLASVLVGIGLTVLYAKHLLPARATSGDNAFFRLVPVLSACVIVVVGLVLTGVSLGIVKSGI